jgi:hypothetical protein
MTFARTVALTAPPFQMRKKYFLTLPMSAVRARVAAIRFSRQPQQSYACSIQRDKSSFVPFFT